MNRKRIGLTTVSSLALIMLSQLYLLAQETVPQEWEQKSYLERGNYLVTISPSASVVTPRYSRAATLPIGVSSCPACLKNSPAGARDRHR